jgi:hypothetical protein
MICYRYYNVPLVTLYHRDLAVEAGEGCRKRRVGKKLEILCDSYRVSLYLNNAVVGAQREEYVERALREVMVYADGWRPLEEWAVKYPDGRPQYVLMSTECTYAVLASELPKVLDELKKKFPGALVEAYGRTWAKFRSLRGVFYIRRRGRLVVVTESLLAEPRPV